jgi:hypothetical protein
MKRLHVLTLNNTRLTFVSTEWRWSFGTTMLGVFSVDDRITHNFPYTAIEYTTLES